MKKIICREKEPKQRKHKKRTSEKMTVFDHLTAHNSTVLNNELNWSNTDWAKETSEIKTINVNNLQKIKTINVNNLQKTRVEPGAPAKHV